jgi:hypothetical protein
MGKDSEGQYTERETVERREAALKRMLATPHKPHSESKVGQRSNKKRTHPKRRKPVEKR